MVGSPQIRDGSVRSVDVKNNNLRGADLRNGTVGGVDLRNGSVGYRDLNEYTKNKIENGNRGPRGLEGRTGAEGPKGDPGTPGVGGVETVGVEVTIPAGAQNFERVQPCPEGKVAVGGGFKASGEGTGDISLDASYPANLTEQEDGTWVGTGWTVVVDNNSDSSGTEQVVSYAVCANAN